MGLNRFAKKSGKFCPVANLAQLTGLFYITSLPQWADRAGSLDAINSYQKSQSGRALEWKMLLYFLAIWKILHTVGNYVSLFSKFE
jgi:hypothetical protein